MQRAAAVTRILVRAAGIVQIVLGLLLWLGYAKGLVSVHMLVGLVLVLGLWILAGLALRAGAGAGPMAVAVAWGIVVVALGLTQTRLLQGSLHWIVQAVHLLVGLGAMGQAEGLAARVLTRPAATATG
ncbi:MAG: hypothetical protein JWM27_2512 [Gemmatimonadetes bacterium]|nr:hypothetical protein [Gemmatimonadota bacterium]